MKEKVVKKKCCSCNKYKPMTSDHFYLDPRQNKFHGACRDCKQERIKVLKQNKKSHTRELPEGDPTWMIGHR